MSASDAVPLPRLGEVFFDVRGSSRSLRLSWYADTGVAVFSIWQGGICTGTFRLPMGDLPRMIETLRRGPGRVSQREHVRDQDGDQGIPGSGRSAAYLPERSAVGYPPEAPGGGYQPEAPAPGYLPEPSAAEYLPEPSAGYQPEPSAGYQPEPSAGYQPESPAQGRWDGGTDDPYQAARPRGYAGDRGRGSYSIATGSFDHPGSSDIGPYLAAGPLNHDNGTADRYHRPESAGTGYGDEPGRRAAESGAHNGAAVPGQFGTEPSPESFPYGTPPSRAGAPRLHTGPDAPLG